MRFGLMPKGNRSGILCNWSLRIIDLVVQGHEFGILNSINGRPEQKHKPLAHLRNEGAKNTRRRERRQA